MAPLQWREVALLFSRHTANAMKLSVTYKAAFGQETSFILFILYAIKTHLRLHEYAFIYTCIAPLTIAKNCLSRIGRLSSEYLSEAESTIFIILFLKMTKGKPTGLVWLPVSDFPCREHLRTHVVDYTHIVETTRLLLKGCIAYTLSVLSTIGMYVCTIQLVANVWFILQFHKTIKYKITICYKNN